MRIFASRSPRVVLVAFGLATCGRPGADLPARVKDGRALTEVTRLVEGKRACGTFMFGSWPARAADYMLRTDSVNALVSAGIVTVRPGGTYDGLPALRLEPTAFGARYFRITPVPKIVQTPDNTAFGQLCYGRLKVESVRAVPDENDPGNYGLSFTTRVVDVAPWALRPDMRRAFPFLVRTERKVAVSTVSARRDRLFGPLVLTHNPEDDAQINDPNPTFSSCSFKAGGRNPQCG